MVVDHCQTGQSGAAVRLLPPSRSMGFLVTAALLLLFPACPLFAASGSMPLWQVKGLEGHVLYLVGAMHALKPADYPLPTAMQQAFAHSDRLVEELDLDALSPAQAAQMLRQKGMLPARETLAGAMDGDWERAQALARKSGVSLDPFRSFKPWLTALEIAEQAVDAAGYHSDLGLDRHFSTLAQKRHMPVTGLETFGEQLDFFDAMAPGMQRRFLLQTLGELAQTTAELARLHAAWRAGDLAELEAIERQDFAGYPNLRRTLLDERNDRWLATLRRCLAGDDTCFVVVGVEHMAGAKGLPALLRAAGYRVIQVKAAGNSWPSVAKTGGG